MNPTETRWDMKSLETSFNLEMLKLCFPEELEHIRVNAWRYLQNKPIILTALNAGALPVSSLLEVRRYINGEAEAAKVAAVQAAKDAEYERELAERKAKTAALDPRALTAQGTPWRQ
jgi:hypothetical protein